PTGVLLCPSFDERRLMRAMDAADCYGDGTPGSATEANGPVRQYLAHYGLGWIWECGSGMTPAEALCNTAGSGWRWRLDGGQWFPTWRSQAYGAVAQPSRTAY